MHFNAREGGREGGKKKVESQQKNIRSNIFKADTIHPIHYKHYKADSTPFRTQQSFSPAAVCYNTYRPPGPPMGFILLILSCTFLFKLQSESSAAGL